MKTFFFFCFLTIMLMFACFLSIIVINERISTGQSIVMPTVLAILFGLLALLFLRVSWVGWQKTQEDPMWDEKMNREDQKRKEAQAAGR